jgi:hypothetical protein
LTLRLVMLVRLSCLRLPSDIQPDDKSILLLTHMWYAGLSSSPQLTLIIRRYIDVKLHAANMHKTVNLPVLLFVVRETCRKLRKAHSCGCETKVKLSM